MPPVFTSGRDYRPHSFFGQMLPPDAGYVRVLVVAADLETAAHLLRRAGVRRYVETLRTVTSADAPAGAVERYLPFADQVDEHPVFLVYTRLYGDQGQRLPVPRFYLARMVDTKVVNVGRIRVVDMGRPDQPHPTAAVVTDDKMDDVVPMPEKFEGPAGDVRLVEGSLAYPTGALGQVVRRKEVEIINGLDEIRERVALVLTGIRTAQMSTDPRQAWMRESRELLALSTRLAEVAAQAAVVETTLKAGTE